MRANFYVVAAAVLLSGTQGLGFGDGSSDNHGRQKLLSSSFGFPGSDQTFDYVIVGGGTAGLTVAARLAGNAALSVAVIEAGGFYEVDAGNFSEIPAYESLYANAPPTIDWKIYTTPQPQLDGRSILYSQGKCLGGSSGRNGMVYQRGTTGSYWAWAKSVKDESYTFENLLPYFKKSVMFTPPDYGKRGGPTVAYDPSAFTHSGGPLKVAYWNYYIPVSQYFRRGLLRLGFKENGGIESGSLLGLTQYPATLNPHSQTRDSSETSFLRQAIANTGLQVYQRTLAKRIIFDGKTAVGAVVETAGVSYTLFARKEVVLAAGQFRSPQLLMVSGIGPEETLKRLNIPIVVNLPGVGQNIWDQPGFGIAFPVNVTTQHQLFSNATYAAEAVEEFITNQSGSLTLFGNNYLAWEHLPASNLANLTPSARTDLSSFPADWPDLQYILSAVGLISNSTTNYAAVGVVMPKYTSRGNLTINTTSTLSNPLVSPNWLSTSTDQQLAIQAVRRARDLAASFGISAGPEFAPGPGVQTDEEILAFVRETVGPSHHAAGSCKMGVDELAVVDTKGKVLGGVVGLRIVDSSIMPLLPPGQPLATVYGVAEKLAEDILMGGYAD